MASVIFDESHGETWTIDRGTAVSISDECPENYYYGHLSQLLRDELNIVSSRMTTWDDDIVKAARVLIIAHPSAADVEPHVGGHPTFSPEEISTVTSFVQGGGGLLVIGEYKYSMWQSNTNDLLNFCGINFNDDTVMRQRERGGPILVRHFPVMVVSSHPIAEDVFEITYHRGCSLSVPDHGSSVVSTPDGEVLCAAVQEGAGRVAVIGDSDLFSLPYIGHSDNVRLFLNIVCWLNQRQVKTVKKDSVLILRRGANIHDFPKASDLRRIEGPHVFSLPEGGVDCPALFAGLPHPYRSREHFLREAEFRFHQLPEALRRAVIGFKRDGNKFGALVLTGLPIDPQLPATPDSQRPPSQKDTFWSESWLAMIGQALGDPIGYSMHHDGEIFQNVCPVPKEEGEQSAHSSKVFLEWHTEQAFHPALPHFVCLLCLRQDHEKQAKTAVASVSNILAEVPIYMRQVLFQPRFIAGVDYSFGAVEQKQRKGGPVVPLLYGQAYDPFLIFDLEQMEPVDRDAAVVLRDLRDIVKQVYNYVRLEPGNLIMIDNRRAIHARSQFRPRYDGTDRWLQRIYAVRDVSLTNEERYRSERIIDTAFSLRD